MLDSSGEKELGRDVDDAMRLFEQSKTIGDGHINPVRPSRVLLVLDGSNQDDASIVAAAHFRERFNTETLVLDGRRQMDDHADPLPDVGQRISGSRPVSETDSEPHDRILSAVNRHDVDLVVLPCPLGRSIDELGAASVGTATDVLLSRLSVPMLIIRQAEKDFVASTSHVAVVVGSECDVTARAAGWALGLVRPSGRVSLNLVIEKEQFENMRSIVRSMDPASEMDVREFSDALTKAHQSLHRGLTEAAKQRSIEYEMLPQAGGDSPPGIAWADRQVLIVLPIEVDDRFAQGFVHDRIRRSAHPVLVVPGHVVAR
ncbi:MAG: universal stress protein [Planctomycetota bacterium]